MDKDDFKWMTSEKKIYLSLKLFQKFFRSKPPRFEDEKWCLDASWGFKGLALYKGQTYIVTDYGLSTRVFNIFQKRIKSHWNLLDYFYTLIHQLIKCQRNSYFSYCLRGTVQKKCSFIYLKLEIPASIEWKVIPDKSLEDLMCSKRGESMGIKKSQN